MTHYIVKHSGSDYRIHAEDGSEPLSSGWSSKPTKIDIADQASEDVPAGSLLGNQDLRRVFVDTISGDLSYRDLTVSDETVPW